MGKGRAAMGAMAAAGTDLRCPKAMGMTRSAYRSQRPPPHLEFEHSPSGTVHDELDGLRGKELCACAVCGRPVFLERNFTRVAGRVIHVRCPITQDDRPEPTEH
jgi:hypothetical protein